MSHVFAPLTVPFSARPGESQKELDHRVRGYCKNLAHDAWVEHGVRVHWSKIREHGLTNAVNMAKSAGDLDDWWPVQEEGDEVAF